eukprot:Skav208109  [mRNA]  locus=scaffold3082:25619:27637:- [translate_table: standard]
MPRRSENWRLHCGTKSDKPSMVADADRDGRNAQALSAFRPVACADSKSLIEDSANDRAAFGKDEAACELLLTIDGKAEHEVISEADDIFTTVLEMCKQELSERRLPGTPTSGTKSPTVDKLIERHRLSDASTRLPEMELDELEEPDANNAGNASSPEGGFDPNSLQTDLLSGGAAEMVEVPQVEHQDHVIQEHHGFLPELWPCLLAFLPVDEVMKMQTLAVRGGAAGGRVAGAGPSGLAPAPGERPQRGDPRPGGGGAVAVPRSVEEEAPGTKFY